MRKLTLRVLMVGVMLFGFAALMSAQTESVAYLVVKMSDGMDRSYLLSAKPSVTFDGDIFRVTAPDLEEELDRKKVVDFHFSAEPVALEDVSAADDLLIRYTDGETLHISGAAEGPVRLYSVSGQLLATVDVVDGEATVSLKGLASACYVVKIGNNQTIKLLNR